MFKVFSVWSTLYFLRSLLSFTSIIENELVVFCSCNKSFLSVANKTAQKYYFFITLTFFIVKFSTYSL